MKNRRNFLMMGLGLAVVAAILFVLFTVPAVHEPTIFDGLVEYSFFAEELNYLGYGYLGIAGVAGLAIVLSRGSILLPLGLIGVGYSNWASAYVEKQITPRVDLFHSDAYGTEHMIIVMAGMAIVGLMNLLLWGWSKRKSSTTT